MIYGILINTSDRVADTTWTLVDKIIPVAESISKQLNNSDNIHNACVKEQSAMSSLISVGATHETMSHIMSASLVQKISIHTLLYGVELLSDLSADEISALRTIQNQCCKIIKVWNFEYEQINVSI